MTISEWFRRRRARRREDAIEYSDGISDAVRVWGSAPEVARYRRKSLIFEGIQWTGDNFASVQAFCPAVIKADDFETSRDLIIQTLEDQGAGRAHVPHVVSLHDTVMEGVMGEFWAVKPLILKATYDRDISRQRGLSPSSFLGKYVLALSRRWPMCRGDKR